MLDFIAARLPVVDASDRRLASRLENAAEGSLDVVQSLPMHQNDTNHYQLPAHATWDILVALRACQAQKGGAFGSRVARRRP